MRLRTPIRNVAALVGTVLVGVLFLSMTLIYLLQLIDFALHHLREH